MEFQKMLTDKTPICSGIYENCTFDIHKHCDIEIIQCLKGKIYLKIGNDSYTLNPGHIAIVGSMLPHSSTNTEICRSMILKVGPSFLRGAFDDFANMSFSQPVININAPDNRYSYDMAHYFDDVRKNIENKLPYSELNIMGSLYKICALITEITQPYSKIKEKESQPLPTEKIENALQYIWTNYSEKVSLEEAAKATGYSKEHFSKKFKEIIGVGFHSYLNSYRVKISKSLLSHTNFSVTQISYMTGFNDCKSFCRVFKKITNYTPSEYRIINQRK